MTVRTRIHWNGGVIGMSSEKARKMKYTARLSRVTAMILPASTCGEVQAGRSVGGR